jgi:tRNA:m4X modification enzyme
MQDNRIQCALCHQWVRADSQRHQNVCSGYTATLLPFYEQGVNISLLKERPSTLEQTEIVEIPEGLYYQLVNKVQFLYESFVVPRLEREADFDALDHRGSADDKLDSNPVGLSDKHRSQELAIINLMEEVGLVNSSSENSGAYTSFVDFGAGKGSLSKALYRDSRVREDESLFILIERDAQKHKAELDKESRSYRARIDLADVNLSKLVDTAVKRSVGESTREACEAQAGAMQSRYSVVGIGKHLCGSATDLAIAALKNMAAAPTSSSFAQGGLCIALCCHSKCSWECLTSRSWLEEIGGITHAEFELLRRWSGFTAVDAQQRAIMQALGAAGNEHEKQIDTLHEPSQAFPWKDYMFRERLGRMCKRLIDVGRIHFIEQSLGMHCRLVTYVSRDVTPENVVLVAYPKVE